MDYFRLIIAILFVIALFTYFIYREIRLKKVIKQSRFQNNNLEKNANPVTLSIYRNHDFSSIIKETSFFIKEYIRDSFFIFIEIGVDTLTTVSIIEKSLSKLNLRIENEDITEIELQNTFNNINLAIDELMKALEQVLDRMYVMTECAKNKETTVPLNKDLLDAYITMVNRFCSIARDYSNTNYSLNRKLKKVNLDKYTTYQEISSKFVYLLFIELIISGRKFDESILLFD